MASFPLAVARATGAGRWWTALPRADRIPLWVVCAVGLGVAGVFSILSTGLYLWSLWTTDPLKSIGGFVPAISLVLIVRAWRALGWERRGSWWGLLILACTVGLVHWRDHAVLELVLSPSWSIFLPPHALVALGYVSGVVLLVGGGPLYRAAWFPIALVLLVNPVPHVFNRWVDLPLQHLSATTARGFAHLLGQRLTPDQLRLMFTPDFGMFIAPGCDGIRGSVTMGLIALVAGYVYRFRVRTWALFVAAAVLLGYVFNLVRLCVLVLYYVVALRFPGLQSRAEMADYVIGAVLFFGAAVLLFSVIRRGSPEDALRPPALAGSAALASAREERGFFWRLAAFGLLVALGSVSYLRALAQPRRSVVVAGVFPATIGGYSLRRSWQERLATGEVIFDWGSYGVSGRNGAVAIGVSPVLGAHDTLLCHAARGEDWLWHGTLTAATANGAVSFGATFFNDGAVQSLEASTLCAGDRCGEYASPRRHLGLVYSRPAVAAVLGASPDAPVPVLLRVETPDGSITDRTARAVLEAELRGFLAHAPVVSLAGQYRRP